MWGTDTMVENEIAYNAKGEAVSFVGPDAVNFYRAAALAMMLGLMAKGIGHSRITRTQALKMATEYTGKAYKRGQYLEAKADVLLWASTMKAALPTRTIGE